MGLMLPVEEMLGADEEHNKLSFGAGYFAGPLGCLTTVLALRILLSGVIAAPAASWMLSADLEEGVKEGERNSQSMEDLLFGITGHEWRLSLMAGNTRPTAGLEDGWQVHPCFFCLPLC